MGTGRRMTAGSRKAGASDPAAPEAAVTEQAVPAPSKTPLYQAYNASRYQRQAVIKLVQDLTGRVLICYVSGKHASIDHEDEIRISSPVPNIPPGSTLIFDVELLEYKSRAEVEAMQKQMQEMQQKQGGRAGGGQVGGAPQGLPPEIQAQIDAQMRGQQGQ